MKTRRFSLTDSAVALVTIIFLMAVLMPALRGSRQTAVRLICQTNLAGIGSAMAAFAEHHDGEFPRAGTPTCIWSDWGIISKYWYDPDPARAFSLGGATITSSFYLLIKYYGVLPKQFLCKGDKGVQEFAFTVEKVGPQVLIPLPGLDRPPTMLEVWDFGGHYCLGGNEWPWPGEFVSYAYHMPYVANPGGLTFTISDISHPRSPVCADRNPFLDKNVVDPNVVDNSASHGGKGQNVLYKDGSVRFEKTVTVGINGDNIYTYGGGTEGTPPAGNGDGAPLNYQDAYLVGEQNF
jgi:hypothetical protein